MEAITEQTLSPATVQRLNATIDKLIAANPIKTVARQIEQGTYKLADISGIASEMDMERMEIIYQYLCSTPHKHLIIDDLSFLYQIIQRALEHETELRQKIDSLVTFIMKQGQERSTFRG